MAGENGERQMVRRCKVGMRSVVEAFRTPSKIDEQGLITIDHMMLKVKQMPCQHMISNDYN